MKVTFERAGETLVAMVSEPLHYGVVNTFRDAVKAQFAEILRNIEIDLSGVEFIDSCGLGVLISIHKTAEARGGSVRLRNPSPPVKQILELARINRIMDIVTTPS